VSDQSGATFRYHDRLTEKFPVLFNFEQPGSISWRSQRPEDPGTVCLKASSSNGFTRRDGWVTLRYMKAELSGKPRNIVDRGRNARFALRHLFAAERTLR
jgi:hypothetical protein